MEKEKIGKWWAESKEKEKEKSWQGWRFKVFHPEKPFYSIQEGLHLRLEPETDEKPFWEADTLKSIRAFLVATGFGKLFVEYKVPVKKAEHIKMPKYSEWLHWVNIHFPHQTDKLQIEILGRGARGKTWGEPVNYPEKDFSPPVYPEDIQEIMGDAKEFMNDWLKELKKVKLFPQGIEESPSSKSPHFILWSKAGYILETQINPILKPEEGIHIVIYTDPKIKGHKATFWEDPQTMAEMIAITIEASKLLYEKLKLWPNVQYNANWGLPFRHKITGEGRWRWATSLHGHIHAMRKKEIPVKLPTQPGTFSNPPASKEEIEKIKEIFKELDSRLEKLVNKSIAEDEETREKN